MEGRRVYVQHKGKQPASSLPAIERLTRMARRIAKKELPQFLYIGSVHFTDGITRHPYVFAKDETDAIERLQKIEEADGLEVVAIFASLVGERDSRIS